MLSSFYHLDMQGCSLRRRVGILNMENGSGNISVHKMQNVGMILLINVVLHLKSH